MKIVRIKIFQFIVLGAIVAFSGCKKDDGPISDRIKINDIPTITTTVDASGSQAIDLLNLGAFSGKFKMDLYFPGTTPPAKVDIVVRKNGSNANVKVYKAGVTTVPGTFTVTASEISTLFGTPIALGDSYDFAPDIYVGERKFEAFPATGAGSGAGLLGMPLYSEFARFAAICAYDPNIYQGDFVVVNDAWADFSPGDVVTFTKVDNTHFSFLDPFVLNPTPIIVTINTANNAVTITKQKIGSSWGPTYSANPATYPNPWLSGTGSVAPCAKTITLTMTYGYRFAGVPSAEATFNGTYALSLKKP